MTQQTMGELQALAAPINAVADLAFVRVAEFSGEASDDIFDSTLEISVNIGVSARQRDGAIDVRSRYRIRARLDDESQILDDETIAWSMETSYVATFGLPEDAPEFSDEQLEAFSFATGSLIIHPYARELVQTASGRMGYPPYSMELLKLPTDPNEKVDIAPVAD